MVVRVILVDYENHQPPDLGLLLDQDCSVKLFLGLRQKCLPTEVSKALQPLGKSVEYVNGKQAGRNAIDFLLTYRLGREVQVNPDRHFYIVSKDRDFDSLVEHLKAEGVQCARVESIRAIFGNELTASAPETRMDAIVRLLAGMKHAKPSRGRTLRSTIRAKFDVTEGPELESIITELQDRGVLTETAGKVAYR